MVGATPALQGPARAPLRVAAGNPTQGLRQAGEQVRWARTSVITTWRTPALPSALRPVRARRHGQAGTAWIDHIVHPVTTATAGRPARAGWRP